MAPQYNGVFWTIGTIVFCVAVLAALVYLRRSARRMGVHARDETVRTPGGPVVQAKVSTPKTRGEARAKQP